MSVVKTALHFSPSAKMALVALSFFLPFSAYTSILLHHFYVQGSYYLDSGLQASLLWHVDIRLTAPTLLGSGSFLAIHFMPLLLAIGGISWLLPLSMPIYTAMVLGAAHAVPSLCVFLLLTRQSGLRAAAAALLISVGFAFNGIALAIIRFPHWEIMLVAAAMLFLTSLVFRAYFWAGAFFLLCLATREDAGLHLFAILAVTLTLSRFLGLRLERPKILLGFAVAALVYSVSALIVQRFIPGRHSAFEDIYLGKPPFNRVTAGILAYRLAGYGVDRSYIFFPALVALAAALIRREMVWLFGYIALVPWLLLHLFANADIPGTLSGYYAFPFMIAAFYPLVDLRRSAECPDTRDASKRIVFFCLMLVASWSALRSQYDPAQTEVWHGLIPPGLAQMRRTDRSIEQIVSCRQQMAVLGLDNAVLALAPRDLMQRDVVAWNPQARYNVVAYFRAGFDLTAIQRAIVANDLIYHYSLPGTALEFASDRPLITPCVEGLVQDPI